jgi:hypothetical protein
VHLFLKAFERFSQSLPDLWKPPGSKDDQDDREDDDDFCKAECADHPWIPLASLNLGVF